MWRSETKLNEQAGKDPKEYKTPAILSDRAGNLSKNMSQSVKQATHKQHVSLVNIHNNSYCAATALVI